MRQSQNEKRIRAMWRDLADSVRETPRAFDIFTDLIHQEHPELLYGFDGDLTQYLKRVLDGMYKK